MNEKQKKYFEKQIKEKRSQVANLESALIECEDKEERSQLGATLTLVRDELNDAEKMLADVEEEEKQEEEKQEEENKTEEERAEERSKKALGTYAMRSGEGILLDDKEKRTKEINKVLEERGKALREKRAILVETGKALLPQHQGTVINDTFNQVSTLVDKVATDNLQGGESYSEAFVKGYGTGGIVEEGADYTTAEPVFEYADMNKVKITAYAEVSEEIKKLPNIDYTTKVQNGCLIALKKKMSQQLMTGTGIKQMTGVFASPIAIDSTKDVSISAIDDKTLDTVIYGYGGDEDVETEGAIILNKNTLKDLAELRKANGDKVYDIDLKQKTINTIPYVINSNVKPFSTAVAGDFIGAYGELASYKAVTFSPVEIIESTDFKFKQGMICFKASVFVAGNVIKQDGLLRLKKK